MKRLLFFLTTLLLLQGCYSGIGLGTAIPVGNYGVIGTSVGVGSDGHIHGNIGVGVATRI